MQSSERLSFKSIKNPYYVCKLSLCTSFVNFTVSVLFYWMVFYFNWVFISRDPAHYLYFLIVFLFCYLREVSGHSVQVRSRLYEKSNQVPDHKRASKRKLKKSWTQRQKQANIARRYAKRTQLPKQGWIWGWLSSWLSLASMFPNSNRELLHSRPLICLVLVDCSA